MIDRLTIQQFILKGDIATAHEHELIKHVKIDAELGYQES